MEAKPVVIDFSRICRLCMSEAPAKSSIFSEPIGEVPIPLRIMACVSIQINQTDGLPSQICKDCLCQVDGWYKFKDLCESTDLALRKLAQDQAVPYETISKIQKTAEDIRKSFGSVCKREDTLESAASQNNDVAFQGENKAMLILDAKQENNQDEISAGEDLDSDTEPLGTLRLHYIAGNLRVKTGENGKDEETSSDENISLMAQKEKLLSEKHSQKRKEGKRKDKNSFIEGRSIQTQTFMTEQSENAEEIKVRESVVIQTGQKKKRNKKTQTSEQVQGRSKKRFRIRPAVPSACALCEKVYKNSEILRQHMKSHHVGSMECLECQTTFLSLRSLKYHQQRKHGNLEPLPCSFCGKKFLDKKYLRIHENIHSQNVQYVCQFCGRKFIMKTNLTVHISRHHTQKTNDFICQVCGKAFPFKLYLKKHFKTHTDYKPYQCQHCEARFRETTLLRKHVNSIHLKLRPFLCQYCHRTFTRSLYLREHMESQHLGIVRTLECPRCGETFHQKTRLRQHDCPTRKSERRAVTEKPASVNSSHWQSGVSQDQKINRNDDLSDSDEAETDPAFSSGKKRRKLNYLDITYDNPVPTKDGKVHQCRVCHKYLKNVTTRNRHEIERHPPPLTCEFCDKTFSTVLTYHTHRNIHLGLTNFKCRYCGKHFASRSNLDDHETVHTRERPVACPQCDKSFSSASNLRVHLKFHAGVKTYFCHICGKGHVTVGNLKLHVKRHLNERNHICHICGKGFNGKSELNKHIDSHNHDKKFMCEYCFLKLKTPNSLKRHINVQHLKLKPYKCEACHKDFARKENLREHMQVHALKKDFHCPMCSREFAHFRNLKKHKCD